MNKKIKFKAYRKKEKKMYDVYVIKYSPNWNISSVLVFIDDKYDVVTLLSPDECELLQYTWLKDNLWKEIYTWDLIKYIWNSRHREIYFDTDKSQFRMRCKANTHNGIADYTIHKNLIVVWNKHENPELLNK